GLQVPRGGEAKGLLERARARSARKDAFQKAWIKLAATRDPLALGALLSALTTACPTTLLTSPVDRARQKFAAWRSRVEALAEFDDDPRMTDVLVELVRKTPFTSGDPQTGDSVYEPAIVLLERLRDARALVVLRELLEQPVTKTVNLRDYLARRLPIAIKTIQSAKSASLGAEIHARIDAIASALGATSSNGKGRPKASPAGSEKELFEAVVVATSAGAEDLGPWEVLADHWLEAGDPRGELVTLQLANERGASNEAQEMALQKQIPALLRKDKDWLDPGLARVTRNRQYRRGMLDSFELLPSSAATAAAWKDAAKSSLLGTVRHVGQGSASEALFATFLTSGAMRSLSDIATRSKGVLEQVRSNESLARRLVHLTFERVPTTDDWLTALTRDHFPSLERLRIVPGDEAVDVDDLIDRLARWKQRPALVEITLSSHLLGARSLSDVAFILGHDRLADVPRLAITPESRLDGFWADEQAHTPTLAVHRSVAKGKARHALEARMDGDEEEIWLAIEAIAKAKRFDQVTVEPLGDPADADLPKALVRRALTALGQKDSILPEAWRKGLASKR
ncbi:MAG: hypothetical protein K0S65_4675, partial [Labilithrix sp.]|nr:hypothetical protein [Labilithrix sp.]